MSIRYGLLALLARGPRHGYQLRAEFEESTGTTWPLNVGQVYTTLARLERDGLVEPEESDAEGRRVHKITPAGREEVARWFGSPVDINSRPRDELAIKIAMALTTPGVDVQRVVNTQRTATVRSLQEMTRLKAQADEKADTAWLLVLDSMIFHAEAEVRWLNHSLARVARAAGSDAPESRAASSGAAASQAASNSGVAT